MFEECNQSELQSWIKFITKKCENIDSPYIVSRLCQEFLKETGSTTKIETFQNRIKRYRDEIHKIGSLSDIEKVKQFVGLSVPVNLEFLKILREKATVTVDEANRIIDYSANDGSFQLKLDPFEYDRNRKAYDTPDLIDFATEKCENIVSPLNISELCREFKERSGSLATCHALVARIINYRSKIHRLENIDLNGKVKQIFGLRASVDSKFLELLNENATVEVDERNRIMEYTANDGSLKLKSNKFSDLRTLRRNRTENRQKMTVKTECDSENDDDSQLPKLKISQKIEEKDIENEEEELEILSETIVRKSDRLSKKRNREGSYETEFSDEITPIKRSFDASRVKNEPVEDVEPMDIDPVTREGAEEPENVEKKPTNLLSSISATLKDSRELDSPYESDTKGDISRKGVEPVDLENLEIENIEKKPTILLNLRDEDVEPMDIESVEREDVAVDKTAALERVEPVEQENIEKKPTILLPSIAASLESTLADSSINNSTFSVQNGLSGVASLSEPVTKKRESILDEEKLVPVSDHINFLESIKNVITTLDIPNLKMLESRIEKKIQKMKESGNKEEEVTLMELRASISTCLLIIQKNSIKELSNRETTTSVKEFLLILRTSLIRINIPILDQSQHQVKKWIQRISDQVSTISIDKLQSSLQSLLDLVAP